MFVSIKVPCSNPLGLESGDIADERLSASSEIDNTTGAAKARLNNLGSDRSVGAWVAGTNDLNQWLKVSFYRQINITSVMIQGRPSTNQFVTKFKVETSSGNDIWTPVTEENSNGEVS